MLCSFTFFRILFHCKNFVLNTRYKDSTSICQSVKKKISKTKISWGIKFFSGQRMKLQVFLIVGMNTLMLLSVTLAIHSCLKLIIFLKVAYELKQLQFINCGTAAGRSSFSKKLCLCKKHVPLILSHLTTCSTFSKIQECQKHKNKNKIKF